MPRPPRVKYLDVESGKQMHISEYPNFSATGSVIGMRELYYGDRAYLVRCGSFIYKVPRHIWDMAH